MDNLTVRPTKALPTLPPKRPEDTDTPWADPWEASEEAREKITGQQITDAINADPAEVELLRKSRKQAREGRRRPWRTATSST